MLNLQSPQTGLSLYNLEKHAYHVLIDDAFSPLKRGFPSTTRRSLNRRWRSVFFQSPQTGLSLYNSEPEVQLVRSFGNFQSPQTGLSLSKDTTNIYIIVLILLFHSP